MIFDHFDNWKNLNFKSSECLEKAFQFISTLNLDCDLGEYPLMGKSMFARVMEYETKPSKDALCESHKKYVDLQATIQGFEDIEWYYAGDLQVKEAYQEDKDVIIYKKQASPLLRMTMAPGFFTLLFPSDAHSPGIQAPESESHSVKKLVVKIDLDLLHGRHPDHC